MLCLSLFGLSLEEGMAEALVALWIRSSLLAIGFWMDLLDRYLSAHFGTL